MDELARQQWREWFLTRRHLLQAGAFALAGSAFASRAHRTAAQATPTPGGKVIMTLYSDVFSFDPIVPSDNPSIWTMLNVYDQLTRVAPGSLEVEPGLAESWESSDDRKTWTLHLREGKTPDGTMLTADDVKYSLERVFTSPIYGFLFAAFDSVTATDERTVTIQLSKPWAPMLADLSLYGASILSQKVVKEGGDAFFNAPYSSGPFSVKEWAKGDHILLEKNPNYWDAPKPYLDEVEFRIVADDNTRVIQLQAGEVDIATDLPYNQIDSLKQSPGLVVQTDPLSRVDYIAFNHTREPFGDIEVRKAINYAVNKDQIIQTVLFGNAEPAQSLLPKMLWWNEDGKPYPYDPA
jgi:peptide/nickel transport system substrate-binding protein